MIVKLMTVFEFYHLSKNFSKYLHFSDRSQRPVTAFAPKRTFLLLFTGWQRSGWGMLGGWWASGVSVHNPRLETTSHSAVKLLRGDAHV